MNLDFNLHGQGHLCRAVQEGVAFAFRYGMKIMEESGMVTKLVRAGHANMFLSSVFCSTLASIQDITLELYDTDGALGAARGAALGAGLYHDETEALAMLKCIKTFRPDRGQQDAVTDAYRQWELALDRQIYPDKNVQLWNILKRLEKLSSRDRGAGTHWHSNGMTKIVWFVERP